MQLPLHPVQAQILYALRHTTVIRYGELLKTIGRDNDTFKFHLGRLVDSGLVEKRESSYTLTSSGKELANKIDENTGKLNDQPKVSMLIVVSRSSEGATLYLAHKRMRQPYEGYWGLISGPVPRGVDVGIAAAQELEKQTGLLTSLELRGVCRVIDRDERKRLLEDKVFFVMTAEVDESQPVREWQAGDSVWMTREEFVAARPLFPYTEKILAQIDTGQYLSEIEQIYDSSEY